MRIALLPLDDRPPNLLFPQQLAAVAGIELRLPPDWLLGWFTDPGDPAACAEWLLESAPGCDAVIVATEMLCFGGLVASRRPHTALEDALASLEVLRRVRVGAPAARVFAHAVIPRLGISVTSRREAPIGAEVARLAQTDDLGRVAPSPAARPRWAEFLQVRARNHERNRALIPLAADGTLDFLLLSQEDAAPAGPHRAEQRNLAATAREHGAGDRVVIAPGADEAGLVLLARAFCEANHIRPQWRAVYHPAGAADMVAQFEDRPLAETVAQQFAAATQGLAGAPQPMTLIVHGPTGEQTDWAADDAPPAGEAAAATAAAQAALDAGPVAVADVAAANGGDPALLAALSAAGLIPRIRGLAAWNTAANSIGTALAQAACAALGPADEPARLSALGFTLCRVVDDYLYQAGLRADAVRHAEALGADPFQLGDHWEALEAWVQERLRAAANEWYQQALTGTTIPGTGRRLAERPELALALPWARCFEVEVRARVTTAEPSGVTDE